MNVKLFIVIGLSLFCTTVKSQAPVAVAGADQSITLPLGSATLDGSASTGSIVTYQWSQLTGPNTAIVSTPADVVTSVSGLIQGRYVFELLVTDNLAVQARDTVQVIVSTRILIDFGATIITSPDAFGNYWNNVSSGTQGIKLTNAITTTNLSTSLDLEIVNRIDGTFNLSGLGMNNGNTTGIVGDYGVDATVDNAFAHPSATDGQWKLSGLDPNVQYTVKFWGTRSVSDARFIEIKRNDESVWQEYDARGNTDFNTACTFTFEGVSEMIFDIRVKSGSAFGHISVIDIQRTASTSPNANPIALAGSDQLIQLPTTTASLDGSASYDSDGLLSSYQWVKIAGPSAGNLQTPNAATSNVTGLETGTYYFELTVTDAGGNTDKDTVVLYVGNRILIDFGPDLTAAPDAFNHYWNTVTTGTPGIKIADAVNVDNTATGISFEIINRIDGTFNPAGPGTNNGNTTGQVGDYPSTVTADYAFTHPSATNGQWKLTGLDSLKEYRIKFWGSKTAAFPCITEIKQSDESVWKSYDASLNTDYERAAIFSVYGKREISFDIRVDPSLFFGYVCLLDIMEMRPSAVCSPISITESVSACDSYTWNGNTYTSSGNYPFTTTNFFGCDSTTTLVLTINNTTTVNAGPDQTIAAGTSATLDGTTSSIGVPVQWTGGTGTFNPDNTTLGAVYTPSAAEEAAGSVTLTLTANAGACGIVSENVTITITDATPVQWLRFSGTQVGKHNQLVWATSNETQNRGFHIERSDDGNRFESIGWQVSAAVNGNSSQVLDYGFTDFNASVQTYFYRLRQVDMDNRFSYSSIIRLGKQPKADVRIYPNPATDQVIIDLPDQWTVKPYQIRFIDQQGKQIAQYRIADQLGQVTIPISGWSSGIYLIQIIGYDGVERHRERISVR
jgi:hypothetical protein